MIVTKLEALLDDEEFAVDAISTDVGLFITENDVMHYLIVEYGEFFTVYLNLFKEDPYTDVLAEGSALNLEEAKAIALNNMNELMYR